jgi:hypothetical protein
MPKNGQQCSDENILKFTTWSASKTDAEFRAMVMCGQLNRKEIAKECGFSKSVLGQNPRVKESLKTLEQLLRSRAILPAFAQAEPSSQPMPPSGDTQRVLLDKARLKRLESENASLRAELAKVRERLAQYELLERYMAETGRLPR